MSVEVRKRPVDGELPAPKRKQFTIPKSTNPLNDEGVSETFQKITTSLYVSLAPCHLANPINGIKEQHLDPLVMTYFHKAQGVVLSYSNIKLSEDNITTDSQENPISIARVEGSSPFTFLWITVDFLIWRPQIGDVLEGYIYMQTASHIGLLLHDTFNASIKKYNIPESWQFIPSQVDEYSDDGKFKSFGYWVDENEIKLEGKLKFTVKAIHTTGRVVSIEGTLIKPGAEQDAQPVFRERKASTAAAPSQHKKFDDDDLPAVTEIPEPKEDEAIIPAYTAASDDEGVVNGSDSDDSSD